MTKLVVLAIPLLLLLAGCDPTPPPVVEPAETATDYLVEHAPAEEGSHEYFHYAFWTDDTKAVRCDIHVGGQSDPFTNCFVMADFESSVTYAPLVMGEDCSDSFEVMLNAIPADAGYDLPRAQVSGCADARAYPSAAIAADTLVLPPGAALELGPFLCSVAAAVATCEYPALAASVSLGLSSIAIVN